MSETPKAVCSKGLDAYVAVDACGTFSETKRQVGLLRKLQVGVILSDYATLMVEILKDNGRPEAGAVYGAMDMDWAKLVGQMAEAHAKQTMRRSIQATRLAVSTECPLWPSTDVPIALANVRFEGADRKWRGLTAMSQFDRYC